MSKIIPQNHNAQEPNRPKKPFDKKTYRAKKYSHKYKMNQWEEHRKKIVLRNYYKDLYKTQKLDELNNSRLSHTHNETRNRVERKPNPFSAAKKEFLKKQEEQKKKKEEFLHRRAEKEEAIQVYKEKKMHAFKKLRKKTKKGQPVMKGRIELLLEKIQQSV